jgi:hypothetical protein
MNNGERLILERSIRQVLVLQGGTMIVVLLLVAGFLFATSTGVDIAVKLTSSVYGSGLSIAGTILSARSVRRASTVAGDAGQAAMVSIYSGLLNKLVIVGGGIAFGLVVLGLEPVLVVTGYIVVQLSTVWTMLSPANSRKI